MSPRNQNLPDSHSITQRVACYVRVSHQEQKLRGLSPEAQRDALRTYAENHNLKIVEWYEDLGVSGRKLIKKRPALQAMIQDAEAGKFDRIIFIKLDRYFRSVAEYYECQKRLEAKNVLWTATEEKYDLTTASGRYWVTQKLAMAEYEADQTGERIDLVNEYKVKTGQPLVGAHALGIAYTVEKDENGIKKVVKDPATKHIVEDYINYYITHQNKRQAQIYINTKYGTNYGYLTLAKVLTDTKTYGHYRGNDFYCEPYIDKATYDDIQCMISNNIKQSHTKRVYLFTGLINCPHCGHKMCGKLTYYQRTIKPSGKTYMYNKQYYQYRCNHAARDSLCTNRKIVNEETMEAILLERLNHFMTVYIESAKVEDARAKNDTGIINQIKQVKAEMSRLNNMYQKGRKSEADYDKEYELLEERLQELESHLEPVKERDLTQYEELLKTDWRAIYEALSKENKRAFWRKYVKRIVLDENNKFKDVIFF